ncbi:MAG TPA: hypothetical protein VF173_08350 [Thermoanaerobaculia bacterium]|nr:hypothetical protein [Thermoanaerobaculia bacterium]
MLRKRALRTVLGVGLLFFVSGGLFARVNCSVTCTNGYHEDWVAESYWACIGFCVDACPDGGGLVGCSYKYPEITDLSSPALRADPGKEAFLQTLRPTVN